MSFDVTILPLEDCLDALIDYRGKTPVKTDSGIPLITAKIIKGGRIETPTEFIAIDNYDAWMRRGMPEAGDVVLTVESPAWRSCAAWPRKNCSSAARGDIAWQSWSPRQHLPALLAANGRNAVAA